MLRLFPEGMERDGQMKTMVLIPCMETVQTEFCRDLVKMKHVGNVQYKFQINSLIYKSRNELALSALAEGADFALWLDSDMIFPSCLLEDLIADMTEERDIVTGVYHMRKYPFAPVIWKTLTWGQNPEDNVSELAAEYPEEIFEVDACGFGCVLMRTTVLKAVLEKFHEMFSPVSGIGEDLTFCLRARKCGFRIWCDPRIQLGHKATTIVTKRTWDEYKDRL